MKKLLEFIVKSISSQPESVKIETIETNEQTEFHLSADPQDIKVIIGKKGRTIKAIRNLLKLKAFKDGKKINLVIDDNSSNQV
jgi:hypothetical protein